VNHRNKILIAYDGSECADVALYSLKRAGLPEDADTLVVSVAESWFPPPPSSSYEVVELPFADDAVARDSATVNLKRTALLRDAEELAQNAAKWILASFPRWDVQIEPLYGSPASELLVGGGSHSRTVALVSNIGVQLGHMFQLPLEN
jgi:hypothetical protein